MKKKKLKKRIIIAVVSVVLIAGVIIGVVIARQYSSRAFVQPVYSLDMAQYGMGDTYSGIVYESAQQKIMVSSDKKVEEVYIKEGDAVKKGDDLFRYDTTLLALDVLEKQLSVNICQTALDSENQKLTQLNNIVPYEEPAEEETAAPAEDASELPDAQPQEPEEEAPVEESTEEHITAQQKADRIADQQIAIRTAQNSLRAAQQSLTEAQEALDNATVTAKFDGTVTQVQSVDSPDFTKPFCTLVGDSGVTVKGYINEVDRASLKIGDALTVTSEMSDAASDAEVLSVNDFPYEGSNTIESSGNPNSSYYEFTAFIDDSKDFTVGEYVKISKVISDADNDLMLIDKAYVRTDNGGAYVMKDDNGVLKKQPVKTKQSSMSGFVYIISGLNKDDLIAFPYGEKGKEGLHTTTEQSNGLFDNGGGYYG